MLVGKPDTALVFEGHTILVAFHGMNMQTMAEPMDVSFPNGLADAMAAQGISQAGLAKAANTSQQQIGKLVHGSREMTAQWANRLAPHLAVPPEVLVFPDLRRIRVPLISWVSAGQLAHQHGIRKVDIQKYLLTGDLPKGDWIALEVSGDSMDRVAPEGSVILVNRADDRLLKDKFYVFATLDGETTFKRYRAGSPPRLQPYSTNPDHETIMPAGELIVLGRVRRVIQDLL